MTTYVSNRDGGKTNEEGHYRFHVKAWTGNILTGFAVSQNSPLSMTVLVAIGDLKIDYSGYGYTAWQDAATSVTITTADVSNPRIDRVVAYIDRGATPSSASSNNPGLLKFKAVAGTPAGSPTRPSDATVNSSVGASNPWCDLADVAVAAGVTTISNGNITDKRVFITVPNLSVGTGALQAGAATPVKRSGGFYAVVKDWGSGTGTASLTGVGFKPKSILVMGHNVSSSTAVYSQIGWAIDGSPIVQGCNVGAYGATGGRTANSISNAFIKSGASTNDFVAGVTSFDADGITVNKTTASSTADERTFHIMFFG